MRSVYFAFITLTTIGFGDYVPTFRDGQVTNWIEMIAQRFTIKYRPFMQASEFGIYFTFYQTFIILWNIIGVGYFIMIIGFIAKYTTEPRTRISVDD